MKSTERVSLFSELVSLWLSASQNVARQRVKMDRVLGVEGGQIQHGGSLVGYLFVLRKFVFEHQQIDILIYYNSL